MIEKLWTWIFTYIMCALRYETLRYIAVESYIGMLLIVLSYRERTYKLGKI